MNKHTIIPYKRIFVHKSQEKQIREPGLVQLHMHRQHIRSRKGNNPMTEEEHKKSLDFPLKYFPLKFTKDEIVFSHTSAEDEIARLHVYEELSQGLLQRFGVKPEHIGVVHDKQI